MGRVTWERFSQIWPHRDDAFANRMNAVPKLVVSGSRTHVDEWGNSSLLEGDVAEEVDRRRRTGDLVICGSASLVRALSQRGLIDELRLLVFPIVIGSGRRLSDCFCQPLELKVDQIERSGAAALLVYGTA